MASPSKPPSASFQEHSPRHPFKRCEIISRRWMPIARPASPTPFRCFGSAVLGLAVERGRLTAAEAYELSRIDEAFQIEQWGEDAEAAKRTARGREEAAALDAWFAVLS